MLLGMPFLSHLQETPPPPRTKSISAVRLDHLTRCNHTFGRERFGGKNKVVYGTTRSCHCKARASTCQSIDIEELQKFQKQSAPDLYVIAQWLREILGRACHDKEKFSSSCLFFGMPCFCDIEFL